MAETTQVPDEIQEEYYAPERKEKSGVAWLLAIGTLILTVLLATGLFFAGRWTYQQIAGNDNGNGGAPAVVENENKPAEEEQVAQGNESNENSSEGTDNSGDSGNSGATGGGSEVNRQQQQRDQEVNNEPETTTNSGDSNSNEGATLGTTGDDPSSGEESGNVAGDSTEDNLPSTGPSDTVAIFVAVTLFGYFVHRAGLLKNE